MTFLNTVHCFASQASSLPRETIIEIAENYEHIFIGTVINKTVESNSTRYVFNVTEYLKHPLNSSLIYRTEHGGSEVAVYPSTTYYVNIEYVMFFDEIDDNYGILGFDYTYLLVNSVDADDIRVLKAMDVLGGGVSVADVAGGADKVAEVDIMKKSDYSGEQERLFISLSLFGLAGLVILLYFTQRR